MRWARPLPGIPTSRGTILDRRRRARPLDVLRRRFHRSASRAPAARRRVLLSRSERRAALHRLEQRDDLSQEQRRVSDRRAHPRARRVHSDARLRRQLLVESELLSERVLGRRRSTSGFRSTAPPMRSRPDTFRYDQYRGFYTAFDQHFVHNLDYAVFSVDPVTQNAAPVQRDLLQAALAGRRSADCSFSSRRTRKD